MADLGALEFIEIDPAGEAEYDLDSLLAGDLEFDFSPPLPSSSAEEDDAVAAVEAVVEDDVAVGEGESGSRSGSPGSDSWMSEIEKFLLDEDDECGDCAGESEFARDLFANCVAGAAEVCSDSSKVEEKRESRDIVEVGTRDIVEDVTRGGVEGEDEIGKGAEEESSSKKRKRQMRNRDSAMKSRERKILYVKDLEMKSKYMQAECQRLDFALRCCMAENMALRQGLQKPLGALMSKQESAVLVMESLLLGSLFWLMSIVCLFLLPRLPIRKQKDVNSLGGNHTQEVVWAGNVANEGNGSGLEFKLSIKSRRCRGTRTKMRTRFLNSAYYFSSVL